MYLFQILLPRADNSGEPFPKQDFDRIKEDLACRFDGVTAYLQAPAEGLWRQGEHSRDDDIIVFEVMTGKIDLQEWRNCRAELERRFRQHQVVIRYMLMELV
ncbi:hypothetical protein LB566_27405 [Mesorhizobium sp. CA13]|uniref:hypothetical protein n=1 Tax=unclassified Mesorhizobium TaxID=325217 RepID=UPI00112C94C4|nr:MULTISPECIES: hypothetical protein [unclassified Mesorhizobium]MBZ9857512.1 hypothetical protein [Mesorhizobium sp. CA13]MBZ9966717.1 hypothetical protein [Mesorhizobium sp. BR1-1-2]MCA0014881.1 hypothetical protein [Mesorhizobium sp. B294B1A1]MCA0040999.1 hypothetical protein [Mesorhizobium sp. B292B1B]TPM38008.1 hypothetical protein FJ964_29130 [Mesorhizobium sp. B2-3-2]